MITNEVHEITRSDEVHNTEPTPTEYHKKKAIFRTYQWIWLLIGFIEVLLAFRFVFEILGANPYSGFVSLIYTISYPFAAPFSGIFGITSSMRSLFDWSLIVAGVVYLIIGFGLVEVLRILIPLNKEEIKQSINTV